MNDRFENSAQKHWRDCIAANESVLRQRDSSLAQGDKIVLLRELSVCYFKLTSGDKIANLKSGIDYCMKALSLAQDANDVCMCADLIGKLGSCTFELGVETNSVNLVHEAVSYHLEAVRKYASTGSYRQQQAMGYGYAAYCIESLPDADSCPNLERRIHFYEQMLACTEDNAPQDYIADIKERLQEAKRLYELL